MGTGVCRVLSALCGVCVVTWVVWQVVSNSEAGWWRPERPWRGLCSAQQQHTSGIRCVQSAVGTVWCVYGDLDGVAGGQRQRGRVVEASAAMAWPAQERHAGERRCV